MEKINDFDNLNKEQKQAVVFEQGPLLIVAGAGTGKTKVITSRIIHLIQTKKIKPEEILALTFTDKAAEEMEIRVDKLLDYGYVELWISTFHSFCERILKTHCLDIGLAPDFKLLDQTGLWLLMRQNFDKFDLNYYKPMADPTKFIHALISHFSKCKDEGIYPDQYLKYADDLRLNLNDIPVGSKQIKSKHKKDLATIQQESDRVKEIANAYFVFQKLLLDNNCLDFGDLINYCLKLFQERPIILGKYRKQFKYILIDEFQDTNYTQYELVKLLAHPKNNLCVCADDDQAVYQFRGASLNNVLQFRKDFPKSKEIILTKNYRSRQNILDLAYNFIQLNNPNRLEYQINQDKKISKNAENKGIDVKHFKKINKKLVAQDKEQGIIEHLHYRTIWQEMNGVVAKITEIMNEDKSTSFNDFAILTRINKTANSFARVLERAKLPYQFLASKGLYSKPVILDIIAYFKLLNNCYENSAVYRILNLPCLNIPFQDIMKIMQHSLVKTKGLYEALEQISLISGISAQGVTKIVRITNLIKKQAGGQKQNKVSEIFTQFLKDSGYLNYLIIHENNGGRENIELINQFYEKIKVFEDTEIDPSLNNFIEQIQMEIDSGEQGSLKFDADTGPETIKIMTIHSAKGLEFKYAFLVSLVDRVFPSINRKDIIQIPDALIKEILPQGDIHLQEERRLFYVAITRAKKGLFLTSADDYGGVRKKKESRFIDECGIMQNNRKEIRDYFIERAMSINMTRVKTQRADKFLKLPGHFSFSQLYTFEKCPLQYKFANLLKVRTKGKAIFSFGKTIHATLFHFVNLYSRNFKIEQKDLFKSSPVISKNGAGDFSELLEIYDREWIDDWYEDKKQKQDYYKLGKKTLKTFYESLMKDCPSIQKIEGQPALEQVFNLKIGDDIIKGVIDRIDELDDGFCEIIDYKTGKAKDKLRPDDKNQLLIYQIAAEKVLGLKPKKLTYHYLDENKKLSFIGNEQDKQEFEQKLLKEIQEIKKRVFPPKPGWNCAYCDYKDICEYRKT